MKFIILSAGRSPRLLPLTKDVPQSMIKVGQKTILERQIEILRKAGIKAEDIFVVTGYMSEKLKKFCTELKIKTLFNPFYDVSGIALSLWEAKEHLKQDFIFMYADILFDQEAIQGLLETKEDMCLAIKRNRPREEAEKVLEERGVIKEISKSISTQGSVEFIGIAKFSEVGSQKFINELEKAARENINSSFINVISNLVKMGEIVAVHDIKESRFIDIDFPEDAQKAEEMFS